jgi:Cdc6-like AAA superfamily ATPase
VQEDESAMPKQIKFHQVFDYENDNEVVFEYIKDELASSLLKDKNDCTVFSYGETGSGKTYTMYYLIKEFVAFLLQLNSINKMDPFKDVISVDIEASCVEINMVAANREQILDLLNQKKEV